MAQLQPQIGMPTLPDLAHYLPPIRSGASSPAELRCRQAHLIKAVHAVIDTLELSLQEISQRCASTLEGDIRRGLLKESAQLLEQINAVRAKLNHLSAGSRKS